METLYFWILIIASTASFTMGSPAVQNVHKIENEIEKNTSDVHLSPLVKCSYEGGITGLISCAATRALKVIQQAARTESFELLPGVALTSEIPQSERVAKTIKDDQLPSDPKQKAEKLVSLILDAASRFLSGRTLKIQIPTVSAVGIARTLEEGREKMKKGLSPLILGLGVKAILFKGLLIVGLGLMAVKALLLSKIALVLAVVLAVQSLFGTGGFNFKNGGGSPYFGGHGWITGWTSGNSGSGSSYGPSYGTPNYPGWTTNSIGGWGNSQYPYARSIDNITDELDDSRQDAQELAYSQQKP